MPLYTQSKYTYEDYFDINRLIDNIYEKWYFINLYYFAIKYIQQ